MAEKKSAAKSSAKKNAKNAGAKLPTACCCPYCETEVEVKEMSPLCKPCGVTLKRCPSCLVVLEPEAAVCPRCGKSTK